MGQQMSGPDSSNGQSIRHESEVWGFKSLSGRDIFCLKNFDTFTRTSVRVSKMNAVARAQLTVQMLTLLKRYGLPYNRIQIIGMFSWWRWPNRPPNEVVESSQRWLFGVLCYPRPSISQHTKHKAGVCDCIYIYTHTCTHNDIINLFLQNCRSSRFFDLWRN